MKRGVICHAGKVNVSALLASARIVRYLADRFDFDVVDDVDTADAASGRGYEFCIVVSSAFGFAAPALRDGVGDLAARAGTYIFVQNDYMTEPSGQIGTAFERLGKEHVRIVWSTITERLQAKRADKRRSTYVNWNMLTYDPQSLPLKSKDCLPALFYYGAHRRERVKYFKAWLSSEDYNVSVSTSSRIFKKWIETLGSRSEGNIVGQMYNAILEMRQLGTFGLYIEDEHSHKHYTSPANRFYEMLSAGIPMLFDRSVKGTFEQAGYDWQQFRRFCPNLTESAQEFAKRALKDFDPENCASIQQTLWARDYRAELDEQVSVAAKKVGLI